MPTKLAAPQYGLHREPTRAPPSSATLQYGGLPTASIPKIHDQPEEPKSKYFRRCGNSASTGKSPMAPTRPQMRTPASHTQDAPHSVQGTTGSVRTDNPNGVPAGRPRPADSTLSRQIAALRTWVALHAVAGQAAAPCRIRLFQIM